MAKLTRIVVPAGFFGIVLGLTGAGLLSWLAIESVLLHRLYVVSGLPPPLRPRVERGDTGPLAIAAPYVFAIANIIIGRLAVGTVLQMLRGLLRLSERRAKRWIMAPYRR